MVDRLYRLGHDAIIGSDYQNGNIGCLCTTRSHGGKRLVTGGVQEGNILIVDLYSICTNVLGNTACLACGNVCMTNCVQNRGLTVVNVTHNAHNGCSALQLIVGILGAVEQLFFNGDNHLTGVLCAQLLTNHGSGIKVYQLVYGCHNAQAYQLLDDLTGSCLKSACQLANRNFLGNFHANDLLDHHLLLLAALLVLAHLLADLLLLAAAAAVTQVSVGLGYKGIQSFIVLGKIDLGGSGIYDAYSTLLLGLSVATLGGLAAHDGLYLELFLRSRRHVIVLIHAASLTVTAVVRALVAGASVISANAILALLCRCRSAILAVSVETVLTLLCR